MSFGSNLLGVCEAALERPAAPILEASGAGGASGACRAGASGALGTSPNGGAGGTPSASDTEASDIVVFATEDVTVE